MLKACQYCGRIHDKKFDCGKKPKARKARTEKNRFRSTIDWQRKAEEIKERDHFICQACLREMKGTVKRLTYENLEVHHAIPLREDFDKRLDNDNLICLCCMHHKMADRGELSYKEIEEMIREQENKTPRGVKGPFF